MARVQPRWDGSHAASARNLTAAVLFGQDAVEREGGEDWDLEELDAIAEARPTLLFVRDGDDAGRTGRMERMLLADERLLITGKLFRFARIDDDDPSLAEELRGRGAGVVLARADGSVVSWRFGRECTSASVFHEMEQIAREAFEGSLRRFQKDFRAALNEYERVDTKRFALLDRRAKQAGGAGGDLEAALERVREEEREARDALVNAFRHLRPREDAPRQS